MWAASTDNIFFIVMPLEICQEVITITQPCIKKKILGLVQMIQNIVTYIYIYMYDRHSIYQLCGPLQFNEPM